MEEFYSFAHIIRPGRKSDSLEGKEKLAVDRKMKVLLQPKEQYGKNIEAHVRKVERNAKHLTLESRQMITGTASSEIAPPCRSVLTFESSLQ